MNKRRFLKTSASAALCACVPNASKAGATDARLNVLFVTVDDMDWSLPGFMGNRHNLTPNLDRLAERSYRFVNNRAAVPICQPSREAMMTGLLPHRSGGLGFTPVYDGTPTLPSILKENGYFTAVIHKIEHMQPASCFPWDFTRHGKDRNPLVYEEGIRAAIAEAKAKTKPFFINCNLNDPHRPFYGSPEAAKADHGERGPYRVKHEIKPEEVDVPACLEDLPAVRKELAQYWNNVKRLDVTIGRILKALRDCADADSTIVLFSSDHGMPFPFAKGTCYDAGTRTPALLSWPGMGKPRIIEAPTCNTDYLPTLLDILGIAAPPYLDGRSWRPLIEDRPGAPRDHVVTQVNTIVTGKAYPMRAIQNSRYALVFSPWADGKLTVKMESMAGLTFAAMEEAAKTDPTVAARVKQYMYGVPLALYDLQTDPGQRVNLIDHADQKDRAAEMTERLLHHMEKTGDPQLENFRILLGGGHPIVQQAPELYRWRNVEGAAEPSDMARD